MSCVGTLAGGLEDIGREIDGDLSHPKYMLRL